jgi:hypothetical protein
MTSSTVVLVVGLFAVLGVSAGLTQRIALARSHRDVGSMAARSVALVVVLGLGVSMVAAPGAWAAVYDSVIDIFGGR